MTYRPLTKMCFHKLFLQWIRIKYVKIQQLCKFIKICSFKTFFFLSGVVSMMANKHSDLRNHWAQQTYLVYFDVPSVHRDQWRDIRVGGEQEQRPHSRMNLVCRRNSKMGIYINTRFLKHLYQVYGVLLFRVAKLILHSVNYN